MTKFKTRGGRRHLLRQPVLMLAVAGAIALLAAGCQGSPTTAPSEQEGSLSASAEEEPATTEELPLSNLVEATATDQPTQTPEPTAEPPTNTPAPDPTATPTPATEASGGGSPSPVGPDVDQPAPDLTLPDLDGNEVTLSDYRGKVVLLNFWTTW